jgi:transmembrane carrier protein
VRGWYQAVKSLNSPATALSSPPRYEVSKDLLAGVMGGPALHLSAGFVAELFGALLWVPMDVVKQRQQVRSRLPLGGRLWLVYFVGGGLSVHWSQGQGTMVWYIA